MSSSTTPSKFRVVGVFFSYSNVKKMKIHAFIHLLSVTVTSKIVFWLNEQVSFSDVSMNLYTSCLIDVEVRKLNIKLVVVLLISRCKQRCRTVSCQEQV